MNIGIIIVFNDNEEQIEKCFFTKQINSSNKIELCLVDNDSKDGTLQVLQDIKEACEPNVSVVEIKRHSSEDAARRAGARYMFNQFNLKHIGYINVNEVLHKDEGLNSLIENVCKNQELMIDFNLKAIKEREVRLTPLKSVFSVIDYLNKIQTKFYGSIPNKI